jgi:hypothetical protein
MGSIPRPPELIAAIAERGAEDPAVQPVFDVAIRDTIESFEATGSRHRRGAAEVPELLDLQRPSPSEHVARGIRDPLRRGS